MELRIFMVMLFILPVFFMACSSVPEPAYTLVEERDGYEMRRYEPYLLARTKVSGEHREALNRGFRILFDYISGNNMAAGKIEMTAPVIQEPGKPVKIPMTAPVIQEGNGGGMYVSFVLPEGYSKNTVPAPGNPAVEIVEVPERHVAVLRYSWYAGEEKIRRKAGELMDLLRGDGVSFEEEYESARYDPPWTPPFMRRNEIFIEVGNP